jgi:hypothetical protein
LKDSPIEVIRTGEDEQAREAFVNDAVAPYFVDVTIASAFVARWCAARRVEIVDGVYRVRDDEPNARIGAVLHKKRRRLIRRGPASIAVIWSARPRRGMWRRG